jgi:beta-xylosidase
MEAATSEWQTQLRSHFRLGTVILDTLLFADDQVIFTKSKDELQMATLQLNNIMATYNLEISHDKTKNMAFCGKYQIRSKIILNKKKHRTGSKF